MKPSKPDPQAWVGRHALRWLHEGADNRITQSRRGPSKAALVANASQSGVALRREPLPGTRTINRP
jgi:hypothetical protein